MTQKSAIGTTLDQSVLMKSELQVGLERGEDSVRDSKLEQRLKTSELVTTEEQMKKSRGGSNNLARKKQNVTP